MSPEPAPSALSSKASPRLSTRASVFPGRMASSTCLRVSLAASNSATTCRRRRIHPAEREDARSHACGALRAYVCGRYANSDEWQPESRPNGLRGCVSRHGRLPEGFARRVRPGWSAYMEAIPQCAPQQIRHLTSPRRSQQHNARTFRLRQRPPRPSPRLQDNSETRARRTRERLDV
jgi:hypothetical protein